jgi:hypothetical protein
MEGRDARIEDADPDAPSARDRPDIGNTRLAEAPIDGLGRPVANVLESLRRKVRETPRGAITYG